MTRAAARFTEADIRRALSAADKAGVPVRIVIEGRDGVRMVIEPAENGKSADEPAEEIVL